MFGLKLRFGPVGIGVEGDANEVAVIAQVARAHAAVKFGFAAQQGDFNALGYGDFGLDAVES